jgi:hypothetical protein
MRESGAAQASELLASAAVSNRTTGFIGAFMGVSMNSVRHGGVLTLLQQGTCQPGNA